MNPIKKSAADWQENAIAKCRADPKLAAMEAAGDLCINCMCQPPCNCTWYSRMSEMRKFYEDNRLAEPVLNMSWGEKGDGLMDGLYRIAIKDFEKEISRLRSKISA